MTCRATVGLVLLAVLSAAGLLYGQGSPSSVGITYIANEGFLLASGEQKVLIDALFREGVSGYAVVPPVTREELKRVQVVNPTGTEKIQLTVAGIPLEIQRATHGTGRFAEIQNLAHIITLGGKRILHVGDLDAGEAEFQELRWAEARIDIALLPYWYLTDPDAKPLVRKYIHSNHIVAMHIPPAELEVTAKQILAHFPNATVFTQPLEKKGF